jgi:glycosyltransferase involved in cell wall biosynthesis
MKEKRIDKILYITSEPFPHGMAGTNRIISLCKGFIVNHLDAEVLTLFKFRQAGDTDKNPLNGTFEGIRYSHLYRSTEKSGSRLSRALEEVSKYFMVMSFCFSKASRKTVMIYYSSDTWTAIVIRVVSILKGSLFLKEETEHPLVRIADMGNKKIYKTFFMDFHYRNFDGLLVITDYLYKYFKEDFHYRKPVILVPMVVDVERFEHKSGPPSHKIVFSGEIDNKKEGVDILIKAFSRISGNHPEFTLNLYGRASDEATGRGIRDLIAGLGLGEKVLLHGYKGREEMTEILQDADIFVFTRPVSLQATYGFSTKLGEYLAAGKPLLATKVGEIEKYLRDGENAFLCDCNEDSITATLGRITGDFELARRVGNMGRACALENFNNIAETGKALEQISRVFHRSIDHSAAETNR